MLLVAIKHRGKAGTYQTKGLNFKLFQTIDYKAKVMNPQSKSKYCNLRLISVLKYDLILHVNELSVTDCIAHKQPSDSSGVMWSFLFLFQELASTSPLGAEACDHPDKWQRFNFYNHIKYSTTISNGANFRGLV